MILWFLACTTTTPDLPTSQLSVEQNIPVLQIRFGKLQVWYHHPSQQGNHTDIFTFEQYPSQSELDNCMAIQQLSATDNWMAIGKSDLPLAKDYLLKQKPNSLFKIHSCSQP